MSVLLAPVVPGSSWLAQKFGTMVQLMTGHNFLNRHEFVVFGATEERDPMCEYCDYNYVPTSARSRNRRVPVTSVDGSSRSVVWFPVHGTALHATYTSSP